MSMVTVSPAFTFWEVETDGAIRNSPPAPSLKTREGEIKATFAACVLKSIASIVIPVNPEGLGMGPSTVAGVPPGFWLQSILD